MTSTDHDDSAARIDAAIIVAGGEGRRLGLDKPEQTVGGRRLLDAALDAVAGAVVVVVGPPRTVPPGVVVTRETPSGGGPLAAVVAGLDALPAGVRTIAVLAADLPEVDRGTVSALAALRARTDAPVVLAEDPTGRVQYLLAVWDAQALRSAVAGVGDPTGLPLRAIVRADPPRLRSAVTDVDTPEHLRLARISPTAVRRTLRRTLPVLPAVPGPLVDGAVLAEPLVAAAPFPPFDQSAMDGWAVAGRGPWTAVDGAVVAGHDAPPIRHGDAVRIATGARLPAGAERVIRDEQVIRDGDVLACDAPARDDVRRAGSAWRTGELLAPAGTAVGPAVTALATAGGVARALLRGPVRVALHTSGDEVGARGEHGLPETAAGPVAALLTGFGARVTRAPHLADTPEAFVAALRQGGADVVAIIGATGRGAADRLRGALEAAGAVLHVDGVDVRPGGSIIVATVAGGPVVLGLGGNPMAALLGAALLGRPVCETLTGAAPRPEDLVALADPNPDPRWRMLPAEPDGAGRWHVPGSVATGHLGDAVDHRAIVLLPPLARVGDLVERLV
ncbi:NTP transferase domain-containing protein [Tsukamurella pseudospumae]|uniref:Molybdopterin molybdenumtransferase n=1 Tax=Tsukamurella pseudospumae TaxID=239498 RepID=A0A138ADZ0_9ACTN|nr:NTP transferase domain-containing protein [Tsukamurella pseudospumae]KXP00727.1 hypothetical protein AXK61_14090 [Tsukamurella pseudospumae]KXP08686.1 hypothetical protein AXK60_08410 [Tsukamurella pseudospumae]